MLRRKLGSAAHTSGSTPTRTGESAWVEVWTNGNAHRDTNAAKNRRRRMFYFTPTCILHHANNNRILERINTQSHTQNLLRALSPRVLPGVDVFIRFFLGSHKNQYKVHDPKLLHPRRLPRTLTRCTHPFPGATSPHASSRRQKVASFHDQQQN